MSRSMWPANAAMGASVGIVVAHFIGGCPQPSPKPPPNDASDAAPLPDSGPSAPCEAACAKLAALGCPEADTLDGGKSCAQLCLDSEASGKFNLKPACVAGAQTVEQVRACGTVRCGKPAGK